jgi:hypothetical protein
MNLNIGNQQAGVINNAGRDQHIYGAQTGNLVVSPEVLRAVSELSIALDAAGLPTDLANQARHEVDSLKEELQASSPDKPRVAGALQRLTGLLVAAGPLATAASSLVGPLQTLATWLGTVGAQVLRMLPALG